MRDEENCYKKNNIESSKVALTVVFFYFKKNTSFKKHKSFWFSGKPPIFVVGSLLIPQKHLPFLQFFFFFFLVSFRIKKANKEDCTFLHREKKTDIKSPKKR